MPNAANSAHRKLILLSKELSVQLFIVYSGCTAGEIIFGNTKENLFEIEKLLFIV
jgi:hypothetical protein